LLDLLLRRRRPHHESIVRTLSLKFSDFVLILLSLPLVLISLALEAFNEISLLT
jgi:hypothetical protein